MRILTLRRPSHRSRHSGLAWGATLCVTAVVAITFAAPAESSAEGTLVEIGTPRAVNTNCADLQTTPVIDDAVAVSVNKGVVSIFGVALRSDGTVAAWGLSEAVNAETGIHTVVCAREPYFTDAEAQAKCPSVCEAHSRSFDGIWANDASAAGCLAGEEAVCGCQLSNVVEISAGWKDAVALLEDGTVFQWGECSTGSSTPLGGSICPFYTPMPAGLSDVIAIDNDYNSIALKSDGTIVTWGNLNFLHTSDCFPKPRWPGSSCHSTPPGLSGVVDVAANTHLFAAVKSDGTVTVWGSPRQGNISPEVPPALNHDIVKVVLGQSNHIALRSDGTVFAWNTNGCLTPCPIPPPADLDNVVDIGFYGSSGMVALKADGTVVRWGPTPYAYCSSQHPDDLDTVVCAGEPYFTHAEAQAKCPSVCAAHLRVFDGTWTNENANVSAAGCNAGQEAVCGCTIGNVTAMATSDGDVGLALIVDFDRDDDGVQDHLDAFPDDPAESADTDGDGVGDNGDAFPDDPTESADTDGDGVGDNGDNCLSDSNPDQADLDGDAAGDVCDDEDAQFVLDRATVWRRRSKLGRVILEGSIPSGVHGAGDVFSTDSGFSVHVTDALALDETIVFASDDCETLSPRLKRCRLPDRSSWVKLKPIEGAAGDFAFKADLRRLDISSPQLGAVDATIRHGDIDRVGSNATCRVYNSKLVCRD